MQLEKIFTNHSDKDGLFIADVTFRNAADRDRFRPHLSNACNELGIVCGVNETPKGFKLGFERAEDYEAVMANAEARIIKREKAANSRADAVLKRYSVMGGQSTVKSSPSPKDFERGDDFELSR